MRVPSGVAVGLDVAVGVAVAVAVGIVVAAGANVGTAVIVGAVVGVGISVAVGAMMSARARPASVDMPRGSAAQRPPKPITSARMKAVADIRAVCMAPERIQSR